MKRLDARMTLADAVLRHKAEPGTFALQSVVREGILKAERLLFDEAAARMIGELSAQFPDKLAPLISIAMPAADHIWIEWPHGPLAEAARARGVSLLPLMNSSLGDTPLEPEITRGGALITRTSGGILIEHFSSSPAVPLMIWPTGYFLVDDKAKMPLFPDGPPTRKDDELDRALWGIGLDASIAPLRGLANVTVHPGLDKLPHDDMLKAIRVSVEEMMGTLRHVVAALAIFNAIAEVGPSERPPGSIMSRGQMKPFVARRLVTVRVPKHRTAISYARSRIAQHRRKQHEVSPHWRHLDHEPNTSGWERVLIGGEEKWRKTIARHMRGDPALGVVEHEGTMVQGPTANPPGARGPGGELE